MVKDLTFVKIALIAYAHPIITIIKLRLTNQNVSISYARIYGNVVILPQQLDPFLNLLLLNKIRLHNIIKVVWLGKISHNDKKFQYFSQVRRAKVLDVYIWLKDHNILHKYISIHY